MSTSLKALLDEAGQTAEGVLAAGELLLTKLQPVEVEIDSEVATITRFVGAFKESLANNLAAHDGEAAAPDAKVAELQAALDDKSAALEKATAEAAAAKADAEQKKAEVADVQAQLESAQEAVATLRAELEAKGTVETMTTPKEGVQPTDGAAE